MNSVARSLSDQSRYSISKAVLPPTSSCLDLTISVPESSGESAQGRAMRNLDINQVPMEEADDREWTMTLSMNKNTISSADMGDQDDDRNSNGGEPASGSSPPRKKLRLSKEQSRQLEERFRRNHTLNPKQKEELAAHLKLKARQVEVWFQNRRARSKLKQTEMECEYLKRWLGCLTERNGRLHKEVEQLRALKVGPSAVHSTVHNPASTLTMCPRCERITTTNPPTPATSSAHVASASASVTSAATLPDRANLLPETSQRPSSATCS